MQNASRGVVIDRGKAALALRALAEAEFSGMPMLESQLAAINIPPANAPPATDVDRLLLLKFGIRRRRWEWTHLVEADLDEDSLRLARGSR